MKSRARGVGHELYKSTCADGMPDAKPELDAIQNAEPGETQGAELDAILDAEPDAAQDERLAAPAVPLGERSRDAAQDAPPNSDETHSDALPSADEPRSGDAPSVLPAALHSD